MNGPNIPHALHSSQPDDEDWERFSIAVIQFSRESLGIELLQKNELQTVREFLEEARYGFEFHGETRNKAKRLMLEMSDQTPLEQFIQALRILELFASSSERTRLASPAYSPSLKERDISRLDQILTYLRQNKTTAVSLEETASFAEMSPKSFCRFFKADTGKTPMEYLHELRIGEACRFLIETNVPISEIALDCGYNNLSNFNRRFRSTKETTPREYRQQFRINPEQQSRPLPETLT